MGQQQILLLVLGVIVIGIAISLAVVLFRENAAEQKRDILIQECMNLGTMAMDFYKKPSNFGGGGRSFVNWQIPTNLDTTENGVFTAVVSNDNVVITGLGNELVTGSDLIEVRVTFYPNNFNTQIVH